MSADCSARFINSRPTFHKPPAIDDTVRSRPGPCLILQLPLDETQPSEVSGGIENFRHTADPADVGVARDGAHPRLQLREEGVHRLGHHLCCCRTSIMDQAPGALAEVEEIAITAGAVL